MAKWSASGSDFIISHAAQLQQDATVLFELEGIRLFGSIIANTPIGVDNNPGKSGVLKNNWQIARKVNDRVLKSANKNKGFNFVEKKLIGKFAIRSNKITRQKNRSMFMFNNLDYAIDVEFGGYPSSVKLGTWLIKQKRFEIRSSNKFSKLAPQGMVRINVLAFKNRMKVRMSKLGNK